MPPAKIPKRTRLSRFSMQSLLVDVGATKMACVPHPPATNSRKSRSRLLRFLRTANDTGHQAGQRSVCLRRCYEVTPTTDRLIASKCIKCVDVTRALRINAVYNMCTSSESKRLDCYQPIELTVLARQLIRLICIDRFAHVLGGRRSFRLAISIFLSILCH